MSGVLILKQINYVDFYHEAVVHVEALNAEVQAGLPEIDEHVEGVVHVGEPEAFLVPSDLYQQQLSSRH